VGIGTDCGGSIRLPASFCGLVGVRSTPGVVARTGSSYLVIFQDTIGPMTRSVADAATVFDVLAGYDESDPYTAAYTIARAPASYRALLDADALRGARLGLVVNALGSDADADSAAVNGVVREAVEAIQAAGAAVVEVEIPDLQDHIVATSQYVASHQARHQRVPLHADGPHPERDRRPRPVSQGPRPHRRGHGRARRPRGRPGVLPPHRRAGGILAGHGQRDGA